MAPQISFFLLQGLVFLALRVQLIVSQIDTIHGWTCHENLYNQGDGICDCECGIYDPDCDNAVEILNCADGDAVCSLNGQCIVWNCDISTYNASDGCHCGCGSYDPDCSATAVSEYEYEYEQEYEPSVIPVIGCDIENAQCLETGECAVWTCDESFYNSSDGCHCGCGIYDPDCDNFDGQAIGCEIGQTCVRASAECGISLFDDVLEFSMNATKIHIRYFDTPTTIPKEITQLQQLTALIIEESEIVGSIPKEIARLSNLKRLSLYLNHQLSGTIPSQISELSELTYLEIAGKQINGSIPSQIGNLTNLIELYFTDSELSGSIPSEFGRLTELEDLVLIFNSLSGSIPPEVGNMERLEYLGLHDNQFNGTIPLTLGKLQNMQIFEIYQNEITGTIPSEVGLLNNAVSFIVRDNHLTGSIPSTLGKLKDAEVLSFGRNQLNGSIPTEIFNITSLKEIRLEDNALSGSLPIELTKLTNLNGTFHTLQMGGNNFQLDCDCQLLSWFPDFALEIGVGRVIDITSINTCSDVNEHFNRYPHTIRVQEDAPCSHATYHSHSSSIFSIRTTWKYDLEHFNNETSHIHNIIGLGGTPRTSEELEDFYKSSANFTQVDISNCGRDFSPEAFWDFNTLGFELNVLEAQTGNVIKRECFFAASKEVYPNYFEFVSNGLRPFTEYEVSIRPFFIYFNRNSKADQAQAEAFYYIFSPRSRIINITTESTSPNAPTNVKLVSAGARDVEIDWEPPSEPNGVVTAYEVELLNNHDHKVIIKRDSEFPIYQFRSDSIAPRSKYNARVRAITTGGTGNWSQITDTMRTCPENMRRSGVENNCNALVGYVKLEQEEVEFCTDITGLSQETCLQDNTVVESLALQKGFWRASLQSVDVRPCPIPAFCQQQSSLLLNKTNQSSTELVSETDRYCTRNHRNVYCMSCDEGYALKQSGCVMCENEAMELDKGLFWTFVIILGLVFVFALARIFWKAGLLKPPACKKTKTKKRKKEKKGCMRKLNIFKKGFALGKSIWSVTANKLRIFIGFLQVYGEFQISGAEKGRPIARSSGILSTLSGNMAAMMNLFSFGCFFEHDHYDALLLYTLYPLGLVVTLLLVCHLVLCYIRKQGTASAIINQAVGTILEISFFVYPGVSLTIIKTFLCEDFDDYSQLRSDYTISCEMTTERKAYLAYAGIMVFIYPCGILLLYSFLLHLYRPNQAPEKASKYKNKDCIKMLTKPYNDSGFWFEAYELPRKLIQVSAVAMLRSISFGSDVDSRSITGLTALNLTILPCVILAYVKPYKNTTDFFYALISLLLLLPTAEFIVLDIDDDVYQNGVTTVLVLNLLAFFCCITFDCFKSISLKNHSENAIIENDSFSSPGTGSDENQNAKLNERNDHDKADMKDVNLLSHSLPQQGRIKSDKEVVAA